VTDISGVREMIPSSTHPEFAGLGVTKVSRRMAFVCTHSGRDACCALWGRELVGACAGLSDEVWECSHIGGHRFAPTALLTPGNLVVGRCTEGVIQDWVAHGSVDADALRGHAHLSASEQAAAVFALRQEADDQSALTTVQGDPDDPNSFLVSTTSGGTWHVTISREALRALRAESCGRDPRQADHFSLVRIAQL